MKKLKFYLIGLVPGILLVMFVLNKKGVNCSGYLPNQRVIAESITKDFVYSEQVKTVMQQNQITDEVLKDSLFVKGEIDFEKSHAQKEPCPDYYLITPEKNPQYEITFEKCKENVTITSLKKL